MTLVNYHRYACEEMHMSEQPSFHATSPTEARAQLHHIIERLSDEEAVAMWRLVCSWMAEGMRQDPED